MNKIQFIGQLSYINFGLYRDTKKNPYTKNKYGLINNLNNKEIANLGLIGAGAGMSAGRAYNEIKTPLVRKVPGMPKMRHLNPKKGSWKNVAIGAAIGAGIGVGSGLLLKRTKTDKRKSKKTT